jgi:hypothetical protein
MPPEPTPAPATDMDAHSHSRRHATWSLPSPRQRKSRRRRLPLIISVVVWVLACFAAVAVYRNVMANDTALRTQAESLARAHAGCGEHCRISSLQSRRSVIEYRADYAIDGRGEVHVVCRRPGIIFGEQRCTTR